MPGFDSPAEATAFCTVFIGSLDPLSLLPSLVRTKRKAHLLDFREIVELHSGGSPNQFLQGIQNVSCCISCSKSILLSAYIVLPVSEIETFACSA